METYRCPVCNKPLTKKEYESALGILGKRDEHFQHETAKLEKRLREAKVREKKAKQEGVDSERSCTQRLLAGKDKLIQTLKERMEQLRKGSTPQTEGLEFEGKLTEPEPLGIPHPLTVLMPRRYAQPDGCLRSDVNPKRVIQLNILKVFECPYFPQIQIVIRVVFNYLDDISSTCLILFTSIFNLSISSSAKSLQPFLSLIFTSIKRPSRIHLSKVFLFVPAIVQASAII